MTISFLRTRHDVEHFPQHATVSHKGRKRSVSKPVGISNLERPEPNLRAFYVDASMEDGFIYVFWVDSKLFRELEDQPDD